MNIVSKFAAIALLLPALLVNTGCSLSAQAESVAYAAIITSADALITALGIAGEIPASEVPYVTAVSNSVIAAGRETTDELRSTDTSAVKSADIAGYWNAVLTQIKGLSPTTQALLAAISANVEVYISLVAPANAIAQPDGSLVFPHAALTVVPANVRLGLYSAFMRNRQLASIKHKLEKVSK